MNKEKKKEMNTWEFVRENSDSLDAIHGGF